MNSQPTTLPSTSKKSVWLVSCIIAAAFQLHVQASEQVLDSLENVYATTSSSQERAAVLMKIAQMQQAEFKMHEAIISFQNAGEIYRTIEDENGIAESMYGLAFIQSGMENCNEALQNYNMSIEYSIRAENQPLEMDGYFGAADCYSLLNKPLFAIEYYTQGLRLANELETEKLIYQAYKGLSGAYSALGKFEEALYYKNRYVVVYDSLNSIQTDEVDSKLSMDEEQSQRIKELEAQLEDSQATSDQIFMILVIGVIVVVILLLVLVIARVLYLRKVPSQTGDEDNQKSERPRKTKAEKPTKPKKSKAKSTEGKEPIAAPARPSSVRETSFAKNVRKAQADELHANPGKEAKKVEDETAIASGTKKDDSGDSETPKGSRRFGSRRR